MNSTIVSNARDLVGAVSSGRLMDLFPTVDAWFPQLVASTAWSVRLAQHFLLLYHLDRPETAALDQEAFLGACEQVRTEILDFLGDLWPSAPNGASQRHLTLLLLHVQSPINFGSLLKPDLLLYILDTRQDPDYMLKLRHEFTHWLWGIMCGEAPAVFNEGVAVAIETLSRKGKTEADLFCGVRPLDGVPSLPDLCANEVFYGRGTAFYRIAGTLVCFLANNWGWDRLAALFRQSTFDDTSIASTFAQVYGVSLHEADVLWRDYFRLNAARYPQG